VQDTGGAEGQMGAIDHLVVRVIAILRAGYVVQAWRKTAARPVRARPVLDHLQQVRGYLPVTRTGAVDAQEVVGQPQERLAQGGGQRAHLDGEAFASERQHAARGQMQTEDAVGALHFRNETRCLHSRRGFVDSPPATCDTTEKSGAPGAAEQIGLSGGDVGMEIVLSREACE
jgi:hypothetical protein